MSHSFPEKKLKHFTIPIFIPGAACPFRCIFCDQEKITARDSFPSSGEIIRIIKLHLSTIPEENSIVEIGFFGGTFTGLPPDTQKNLLETVQPFVHQGRVRSIRLSTRPDFITQEILDLLAKYPVRTIELGAQSMDEEVLVLSSRGHTAEDTRQAARMIRERGFSLGLQMMIGLPGDSAEKSVFTAINLAELHPAAVRIYPVLVIRGTHLEQLYKERKFNPLTLHEAIEWAKQVFLVFDERNIPVIRMGLHPSDGLMNKEELVAGPFHPSFRELVLTDIWYDRLSLFLEGKHGSSMIITVNPADFKNAIGYSGRNRKMIHSFFREVKFVSDPLMSERSFHADYH
jgi:histone acetyltransferase (RNA polymerase elongator complex component)